MAGRLAEAISLFPLESPQMFPFILRWVWAQRPTGTSLLLLFEVAGHTTTDREIASLGYLAVP